MSTEVQKELVAVVAFHLVNDRKARTADIRSFFRKRWLFADPSIGLAGPVDCIA